MHVRERKSSYFLIHSSNTCNSQAAKSRSQDLDPNLSQRSRNSAVWSVTTASHDLGEQEAVVRSQGAVVKPAPMEDMAS